MFRVTMDHLTVTLGHLRVTVGHPRVTVGQPRVTIGHLRLTISKHKANTTEIHLKVRQTCEHTIFEEEASFTLHLILSIYLCFDT